MVCYTTLLLFVSPNFRTLRVALKFYADFYWEFQIKNLIYRCM